MRALLWTLGIALLLIAVAIIALPLLIDEKALVAIAARQVKERSGIELSVDGAASLSLFPRLSLVSTEVRIEVPQQGSRTARFGMNSKPRIAMAPHTLSFSLWTLSRSLQP